MFFLHVCTVMKKHYNILQRKKVRQLTKILKNYNNRNK